MDLFGFLLVSLIFFSLYVATQSSISSEDKALFDNLFVITLIYIWFITSSFFGLYVLLSIIDSIFRFLRKYEEEVQVNTEYISIPNRSFLNLFKQNRNVQIRKDTIQSIVLVSLKSEFLNFKKLIIKTNNNAYLKMHMEGIEEHIVNELISCLKQLNFPILEEGNS